MTAPLRVLVLTNMYPPHHYGGYELNCQEFVAAVRAAGHEASVLTSDIRVTGTTADLSDGADPTVRRRLRLYWDDHVVQERSLREALAIERANQHALREAIEAFRPDVVSGWHLGALSLGLLTTCQRQGLPVVLVVNDDWPVYAPLIDGWVRRCRRFGHLAAVVERLFGVPCRPPDLGSVGTVCFVSEATKRAAELGGGWRFDDATVGYCGINTEHFPIGAHPAKTAWSWRLLHVGRIDDRKGIDTAVRALSLLPDVAVLEVVGWGDEAVLADLRRLAADLEVSDRVRFSVADRPELGERYANADALLFLPRWAEPFGLVPIEAMACGTPVVATGTGGSSEFLLDGANCLRVPVDEPEAVAAAVTTLATDAGLRAQLVAGGSATAEELSLTRWTALLLEWHLAAAGRGPRPPHRPSMHELLRRALGSPAD